MDIKDISNAILIILYIAVAMAVIGKYEKKFKVNGKIDRHDSVAVILFGASWIISLPLNYLFNKSFK